MVRFRDEYEVSQKYYCNYRVLDRNTNPNIIYVRCECWFEDYVPLARGVEVTPRDKMAVRGHDNYSCQVYRYRAWEDDEDLIDDSDSFYLVHSEREKIPIAFRSSRFIEDVSILKGFTTWLHLPKDATKQEIEEKVKKWVKDLVVYFVIPQVKIKEPLCAGYVFEQTRPKNYFDVKKNINDSRSMYSMIYYDDEEEE